MWLSLSRHYFQKSFSNYNILYLQLHTCQVDNHPTGLGYGFVPIKLKVINYMTDDDQGLSDMSTSHYLDNQVISWFFNLLCMSRQQHKQQWQHVF